jgi:radical SAM superfamily enzyme YgiQ (UPF0313 family)
MILLINPPSPEGKVSNKDMMGGLGQLYDEGGPRIPPIDLPYTAACLKAKGYPVTVIDSLGLGLDREGLLRSVRKEHLGHQDLSIAIRISLPTLSHDLGVAEIIKKETGRSLIIFGPLVSLRPQEVIEEEFVDVIVLGEPERALVDLFSKGAGRTAGIWYKDEKNRIVKNGSFDFIKDLDQLPFPAWELMPYKSYVLPKPQFPDETPFLPVLTSRGCPFACGYCPYPATQGPQWRARSPENVAEELAHIVNGLGIHNVLFRDPEFTFDRERTLALCERIVNKGLELNWRCETRIDTLDGDLIKAMGRSGCRGINIGVETLSAEILKKVGRKDPNSAFASGLFDLCKEVGIHTFCFFILGLPGQRTRDVLRDIDFMRSIDPAQVQFTFATPYPGTDLFRWAEANGFRIDKDWMHYTGYIPVMRNESMTADHLRRLHRFACRSLWMRRSLRTMRVRRGGAAQWVKELVKELLLWIEKLVLWAGSDR